MAKSKLVTPGEILKKNFLDPMGITAYKLSQATGIRPMSISNILKGKTMSLINCLILSKFFDLSEEYWIDLQNGCDKKKAKIEFKSKLSKVKSYHDFVKTPRKKRVR